MSRAEAEPCSRALAQARVYLGQLRGRGGPAGPEGGGRRDYLVEAARQLRLALERDVSEDYQEAFNHYQNGVDVLLRGVQGVCGLPGQRTRASLRVHSGSPVRGRGIPAGIMMRRRENPSRECVRALGHLSRERIPAGRRVLTLPGWGVPLGAVAGPPGPGRAPHSHPLHRPQLTPTRSVGRP